MDRGASWTESSEQREHIPKEISGYAAPCCRSRPWTMPSVAAIRDRTMGEGKTAVTCSGAANSGSWRFVNVTIAPG
jgi:hypothetical protein